MCFIIFLIILYLILSSRNNFMNLENFNSTSASHSIVTVATLLMYLCLERKTSDLIILRKVINKLSDTNNKKTTFLVMHAIIFLSFLVLLSVPIAFISFYKMTMFKYSMWRFHNIFIEILMTCLVIILCTFLRFTITTVLTIVFCAICYQWIEIIRF